MSSLRTLDMILLEELFEMGSGYVLNFSDRTFAEFFADELGIDIDLPRYSLGGRSKAKRLRYFLRHADDDLAGKTLLALWEYREAARARSRLSETVENAESRLLALANRLQGRVVPKPDTSSATVPGEVCARLRADLIALTGLAPNERGYAFERFLVSMFNAYGLAASDPFRLRGEQIDGSFQLAAETYLIEAKWHALATSVSDLHVFHGKIEQKAAWTRGVFISNSGFTPDGLDAFGRGKRLICIDGLDIYETLDRPIHLAQVIQAKVRRAAETGSCFVRVRDLFPTK